MIAGIGLLHLIRHPKEEMAAVFGVSALMAAWTATTVAMTGVSARFSSFNLERSERLDNLKSFYLAEHGGLAREQARA